LIRYILQKEAPSSIEGLNETLMKQINYCSRLVLIILAVQAISCQKVLDNSSEEQAKPNKSKGCQISRIHFFEDGSDYYGDFYNNKSGDPDSVIFGFVGTGFPNLHFKYNSKRQLIQAKFVYSDGTYETWHKFGYTKGQITTDTVYVWGSNEEPEPEFYYSKSINQYEYDSKGRIIKLILDQVSPDMPPNELIYSYNENGNQIYGENLNYDHYINIHTLNPIWQFFAKDFSANNPIVAKAYNSFNLPAEFDNPSPDWQFPTHNFFGRSLNKAIIEYDCDGGLITGNN
jgi:hypothetical protein